MKSNAINGFLPVYRAYKATMHGKDGNITALKYDFEAVSRCYELADRLQKKEYRIKGYFPFEVYEPKRRLVLAIDFEGKIVQHAICDNALYPALAKRVITDNYAVQIGKGTHYGLDRLTKMLRHYYFSRKAADLELRRGADLMPRPQARWDYADGWVLKGDFSKYFYSLRHAYCKAVCNGALKSIADGELLDYATWLLDVIIDSTPDPGIPIGNQTSQLIALLYLDEMDHWLTDGLGLAYGRYMDDFFIIHESKDYLKGILAEIKERTEALGLTLNPKTQILPLKNGIDFLGFHTYLTQTGKVVRKVRSKSVNNMRRKLRKFRTLVDRGKMDLERVRQSYASWCGHISHGNTYHLAQKMDRYFYGLFPELKEVIENGAKIERVAGGEQDQVRNILRRSHTLVNRCEKPNGIPGQFGDAANRKDHHN